MPLTNGLIINPREMRGKQISEKAEQVKRVDDSLYYVLSQRVQGKFYQVMKIEGTERWVCNCPDFMYRGVDCKHLFAVKFSFSLRSEVEVRSRLTPIGEDTSKCIYCGSENISKQGLRKNRSGDLQKFFCGNCSKYFSFNIGFERMKHNPQAITSAMQLYFSGESLRHTQKSLELLGVKVCHKTIYNWIEKYVSLMQKYLDKITPNVSSVWRADEIYVKVRGNMRYVFALMDDQTRYWIAQEVADSKDRHDAKGLFLRGKEIAGKKPATLITDGLGSYHDAYKKAFVRRIDGKRWRTEHIRDIRLDGSIHNNKMERMNGEIRDREKTMRGLKIENTPILKGMQIFHNFVRPHEALGNLTPAEACGIKVEGENKWKTIIQNASTQCSNKAT